MSVIPDVIERIRTLVWRGREEAELDEELRFHLEMQAERFEGEGAGPGEAWRRSRLALGGVERTKEDVRDARGTRWLEDLAADVSFALRTMRRSPIFAATIIVMLAIGIGANTTIFTLVDAVAVRNLPVEHPEELVAIGDAYSPTSSGQGLTTTALSYPLYKDVVAHGGHLGSLLASGPTGRLDVIVDNHSGELEHPAGRFISGNYFAVLGVPAWRGRVLKATEEALATQSPVAVISHDYWTKRFHEDPAVIGRSIVVNNVQAEIIGVAPPSFTGEVVGHPADVWLPIAARDIMRPNEGRALPSRRFAWLLALGRLEPGASIEQVRTDLGAFIIRTMTENAAPDDLNRFLARKEQPIIESGSRGFSKVRGNFETPLFTIMIGVGLLLCIICANVANLLLARAVARRSEMALRLALGAGQGRLIRLLLTESTMLALVGAAAGILLATGANRALLAFASDGAPIPLDLSVGGRAMIFTLVVSVTAVLLFGLVPALQASRYAGASAIRSGTRSVTGGALGARGRRVSIGGLLIGAQVAFSVVLLVGAAMLTRSLRNIQGVEVGFDRDHLILVDVDINVRGYRGQELTSLANMMRERIAAVPGVRAVSYSENGIFTGTEWSTTVSIPGVQLADVTSTQTGTDNVSPGYFSTIGARVVEGRDVEAMDIGPVARVAVVNQAFAVFYFKGVSAVGKSFVLDDSIPISIVGVVADPRSQNLTSEVRRRVYFPYSARDTTVSNPTELRFLVRTADTPGAVVEQVRAAVISTAPTLPIDRIQPLGTLMRQSIREERLVASLASAFSLLALLLASIGLYGVMTYAIQRRTGELGLRAALGAQGRDLLQLALTDAWRLVAFGAMIGLPVAIASTRLLRAQLHNVDALDPKSIGAALAILALSASVAALIPAFKAARVSPLVALRSE
jgi:predicted permease